MALSTGAKAASRIGTKNNLKILQKVLDKWKNMVYNDGVTTSRGLVWIRCSSFITTVQN